MKKQAKNQTQVFWILWSAILSAVMFFQFQIAGGLPEGEDASPPPVWILAICFLGVAIATVIRWGVLPRVRVRGKALVCVVVGLALAEQAQILQLFLLDGEFAASKRLIFYLSLLGVVQFAPTYAKGLVGRSES